MASPRPAPFCFSAFLLFSCVLPLAESGNLDADAEALLAFASKLDDRNGSALASWSKSATDGLCTNWTGISCGNASAASGSQLRVVAVLLPTASLSGQISPSTLGLLDALQNLSLSSNQFYGDLPSDLANCSSLRSLLLQRNAFSGALAASVFSWWPLLEEIDLSFNKFNGSIPPSIREAKLLQSVNLRNNSFTGRIPEIISTQLKSFDVANNELEGGVPASMANFSAASFAGNEGLCGSPLNETCKGRSPSSKLSVSAIVGMVIGAVCGGCLPLVALKYKICRNRIDKTSSTRVNPQDNAAGANAAANTNEASEGGINVEVKGEPKILFADNGKPAAFDIDKLLRASAEVMGNGSLGTAYKAILETFDGNELFVVVKRLNFKYKPEYESHLRALAGLRDQNPNLVPIEAWYFFEDEKLVVYEYLNGISSLHDLLHCGGTTLAWTTRLWVAGEVARAVAELHERETLHGNMKSSNVLINPEGWVGLTDYGLVQVAISLPRAATGGNPGYTAPELLDLSRPTKASDVYSYGVLLLELLTGKSPLPTGSAFMMGGHRHHGDPVDLARWVQTVVRDQWTAEVLDLQIMRHDFIQEEMMQLLQIALPCVSPSPAQRPSMRDLTASINLLTQSDRDDESSVASSS